MRVLKNLFRDIQQRNDRRRHGARRRTGHGRQPLRGEQGHQQGDHPADRRREQHGVARSRCRLRRSAKLYGIRIYTVGVGTIGVGPGTRYRPRSGSSCRAWR
ncbi:MAG: hypothetical protein MZV63_56345 [Marinilabiliales bacterium]|nr:hypothetical protein [Marinilabiliales bacterium]